MCVKTSRCYKVISNQHNRKGHDPYTNDTIIVPLSCEPVQEQQSCAWRNVKRRGEQRNDLVCVYMGHPEGTGLRETLSVTFYHFLIETEWKVKSKPTNAQIINRYKVYLQHLHMIRQINCHPQGVSIKELQVRTASKYTICGSTAEVLTELTIFKI